MNLQKPKVDPAAPAEALFSETWVADQAFNGTDPYTVYTHYVRLKIFTEAGVNKYGTVNVEYYGKVRVSEVSARTIEPDGSTQEMKKDAIFDHAIQKRRHLNWRAVSFAMPGVKVGAILEYRWREFHDGELANYAFLRSGEDFPIERAVFHIKPLDSPYFPYQMRGRALNAQMGPIKREPNGYSMTELDNIPAFLDEEDSPPEMEIQPTIVIFYAEDRKETPEHFWKTEGKERYVAYRDQVKVNGEVKQIAEEVTAGATSDEDRLARLTLYCSKHIKDVTGPDATDIDRQGFKPNHQTTDTLKRNIGTPQDIDLAFVALAQAAGFDARIAYVCDRQRMIFRREMMIPWFPEEDVAVQVNGRWKLFDIYDHYVTPGTLPWYHEGTLSLIADGKNPELFMIDVAAPDKSRIKRMGQLTLGEDGTLEGNIQETLTGHPADEWRQLYQNHSEGERVKMFSDEMKSRLPGAEISEVKMSDPGDVTIPVRASLHVKMEGFGTRTGKRLFFSPAVLETNQPVRYASSTRKYDVLMRYPWSEQDDLSIKIPAGYKLDHPDVPASVPFAPVGAYKVSVTVLPDRIFFHRDFEFGDKGAISFAAKNYPTLKRIFELVHDGDTHLLTLNAEPATAAVAGN